MRKGPVVLVVLLVWLMVGAGCEILRPTPTAVPPTSTSSSRVIVISTPAAKTPLSLASPVPGTGTLTPTPTANPITATVQPGRTPTPEVVLPPAMLPVGAFWESYGAESGVDESLPVEFDPTKGPWNLTGGPATGVVRFEVIQLQNAPLSELFADANYVIRADGFPYSTFYYYRVTQQEMIYYGTASDRAGAQAKRYSPGERIADWSGLSEWKTTMSVLSGDQSVGEAISEVKIAAPGRVILPYGEFDSNLLRFQTSEKTLGIARTRIEYRWLATINGKLIWVASLASQYNEKKDPFTDAQQFSRLKSLELVR